MDQELEGALKRIVRTLDTPSTPKETSRFGWINSSFIVTVLGGIVLAIVSALFTKCSADAQKDLEELHRKETFIETFTTKVEQYLALTYDFRKRDILLAEDAAAQRFGKAYDESLKTGQEEHRYWIEKASGTTPTAAIYTAKALFPRRDIVAQLYAMRNTLDRYDTTMDPRELNKAYETLQNDLEQIIGLMVGDLRK